MSQKNYKRYIEAKHGKNAVSNVYFTILAGVKGVVAAIVWRSTTKHTGDSVGNAWPIW